MSAALLDPPVVDLDRTYSPDDLLALPDDGKMYELVADKLVEVGVSELSNQTAIELILRLGDVVRPRGLGKLCSEGSSFRCFPGDPRKVRRPDAGFIRADRYSPADAARRGHYVVCPDLVVEVVSPNDLAYDVAEKRQEWLAAGAQLVWVVLPIQREVYAYPAGGGCRVFGPADVLTADPVLPDFRVPVAELFPAAGTPG
jgi:Uma2 family endonuclease